MKSIVVAGLVAAGLFLTGPVSASTELATSAGCLKCHDIDKKKMGPGFKDVAAKYKGKAGADAELAAKLIDGKGHKKIASSEADVKTLVKWVLAM